MAAKRFLYVSLGILALATAFHLGALSATATTGEVAAAFCDSQYHGRGFVVTPSGDVYSLQNLSGGGPFSSYLAGNVFAGVTATEKTSWTDIKKTFQK